ncbi:MAG: hypothetical protein ACI9YO_001076 [Gammaproteobacteria bacterium]|jgi:hypothetical protein
MYGFIPYDEVNSVILGMRPEKQLVNNFRAIGQRSCRYKLEDRLKLIA